ncbi:MAG: hypothetical protein ACYSYU_08315 [Planctomycetota bacterium]|jgi:hypothetical protein
MVGRIYPETKREAGERRVVEQEGREGGGDWVGGMSGVFEGWGASPVVINRDERVVVFFFSPTCACVNRQVQAASEARFFLAMSGRMAILWG